MKAKVLRGTSAQAGGSMWPEHREGFPGHSQACRRGMGEQGQWGRALQVEEQCGQRFRGWMVNTFISYFASLRQNT